FDASRFTIAAVWISIEVVLGPFVKMGAREHWRLMRRYVFDESRPLVLDRDDAPRRCSWRFLVATTRSGRDRTKQNDSIEHRGLPTRKSRGRHRCPGVADQR